ncbi:MAG: DUF1844 domain-containing protein [Candidatus Tantalella remota]|nr:DUF1844 domain-containing protein [Candidatus Tantalella remota]
MNEKASTEAIKVDFTGFLSGLMAEGLIALGVIEHPHDQKMHKDLRHATMVIDTIALLKEKTEGNLTKEEAVAIEGALHQLRMMYVAAGEPSSEKKVPGSQQAEKVAEGAEKESSQE